MDRPLKKTESIEIRLPHETKQAFMARCREDGVSASEAVRGFIGERLAARAPAPSTDRRRCWRLAAGLAMAAGVAATAAPSLAGSVDRIGFSQLDRDASGELDRRELAHGARLQVRLEVGPGALELDRVTAPVAGSPAGEPGRALLEALVQARFTALDLDANGGVSFSEFRRR